MWKLLFLLSTASAVGSGSCVCGKPCIMTGGGSGVCQTNGDCAVNIMAPNCNGPDLATFALAIGGGSCVCGKPCKMTGGGSGVCQTNGDCAVNVVAPNCNGPVAFAAAVGVGGTCVCGKPCTMTWGGSGVCQTNGDCAVNVVAPNCGGQNCPMFKCAAPSCPPLQQETPKDAKGCPLCPRCRPIAAAAATASLNLPTLDLTSKPPCPVFRCIPPVCVGGQTEIPKDSNGCPLCPRCTGVQLGPPVFAAASASAVNPAFDLDLDIKTSGPNCPVVSCLPPNCPVSQQETPKTPQGCPLCPRCKGVVGVPPVFTSQPAPVATLGGASLDLTAVVCPLLACVEPNCPPLQQQKTTGANGCPGCPRCRPLTAKAPRPGKGKAKGLPGLDGCALILCLPDHKCVAGKCEPLNASCALVLCAAGTTCQNGICIASNLTGGR